MASVNLLKLFPSCLQNYETATQAQKDKCNLQLSLKQAIELFWRAKKLKATGNFSLDYILSASAFTDNSDSYEGCSPAGNYAGSFFYWPLNMTNFASFEVISPLEGEYESEKDLICQQEEKIFIGSNVVTENGSFDAGSGDVPFPATLIDSGTLKTKYYLNCSFDWENALATYDSNQKISTVYIKADISVRAVAVPNWNQPRVAGCEDLYVKDGEYFQLTGGTAEQYRSYIKNRDENSFSYENRAAEKDTTMQFKFSDGPSAEIDIWTVKQNFDYQTEKDITSMTDLELSIGEFWEYDPNDGNGPKYGKYTGAKLRYDI